jgi:hypothetical protein
MRHDTPNAMTRRGPPGHGDHHPGHRPHGRGHQAGCRRGRPDQVPAVSAEWIVLVARTPVGSFGGVFKDEPAHELGAAAARGVLERSGVAADARRRGRDGLHRTGRPGRLQRLACRARRRAAAQHPGVHRPSPGRGRWRDRFSGSNPSTVSLSPPRRAAAAFRSERQRAVILHNEQRRTAFMTSENYSRRSSWT